MNKKTGFRSYCPDFPCTFHLNPVNFIKQPPLSWFCGFALFPSRWLLHFYAVFMVLEGPPARNPNGFARLEVFLHLPLENTVRKWKKHLTPFCDTKKPREEELHGPYLAPDCQPFWHLPSLLLDCATKESLYDLPICVHTTAQSQMSDKDILYCKSSVKHVNLSTNASCCGTVTDRVHFYTLVP